MNFAHMYNKCQLTFPKYPTMWSVDFPIPVPSPITCKPFVVFWVSIILSHWLIYVTCNNVMTTKDFSKTPEK